MKIISGGQTGADRAALDFAIENDIPHGGWCPRGRKAIDGRIDEQYQLTETPSANYLQRTEWNVRDSDATVIFTLSHLLNGGSRRTAEFALKHGKPWIHIHPENVGELSPFLDGMPQNVTLNIAGSREGEDTSVYRFVTDLLGASALAKISSHQKQPE